MGAFGKLKNIYQLQKKAKALKKQLKNVHIEAEAEGVMITLDGELRVISVVIAEQAPTDRVALAQAVGKAMGKAIKKAQEVAGGHMKEVWGEIGIPGMTE